MDAVTAKRKFKEVSAEDLETAMQSNMLSDKTNRKNKWAFSIFTEWLNDNSINENVAVDITRY